MTLAAGRTTVAQGAVHLVILAAFLFFDRQASVKLTGGVGLVMAPSCGMTSTQALPQSSEERPCRRYFAALAIPRRVIRCLPDFIAASPLKPWR